MLPTPTNSTLQILRLLGDLAALRQPSANDTLSSPLRFVEQGPQAASSHVTKPQTAQEASRSLLPLLDTCTRVLLSTTGWETTRSVSQAAQRPPIAQWASGIEGDARYLPDELRHLVSGALLLDSMCYPGPEPYFQVLILTLPLHTFNVVITIKRNAFGMC